MLKQSLDSKVSQESVIKLVLKVWRICLLAVRARAHPHRTGCGEKIHLIPGEACRKSALQRVKQLQTITEGTEGQEQPLSLLLTACLFSIHVEVLDYAKSLYPRTSQSLTGLADIYRFITSSCPLL